MPKSDDKKKPQTSDSGSDVVKKKLGVVSSIAKDFAFVYQGQDAPQQGVEKDAIDPKRASVLHGKIVDAAGNAIAGVEVSLAGSAKYGKTVSKANGEFDFVFNGGGPRMFALEKVGFFPARRRINTKWQDHAHLDIVRLMPKSDATNMEKLHEDVHRSAEVEDEQGKRRSTLFTPTTAKISTKNASGKDREIAPSAVRASEYTVGAAGQELMPAPLPPTSAYTYAVELTAVEGVDDLDNAEFSEPTIYYVENFLTFPVGGAVPSGYYDKEAACWVPSEDGRVIQIIKEKNGIAEIDTEGKGKAASKEQLKSLGITDDELKRLAVLYEPGQSIWRIPLAHFSTWDFNWPPGTEPEPPNIDYPETPDAPDDDPCLEAGSVIEIQNQVLIEQQEIVGAPFSLCYSSARANGSTKANVLFIPISADKLPAGVLAIKLEVSIAGRKFSKDFEATPNQIHTFVWDGKDSYDRPVNGSRTVNVRVGYVYRSNYSAPVPNGRSFALVSGVPMEANQARQETILWKDWSGKLGHWSALESAVGGWSPSVHHAYDPSSRTIYFGDGHQESAEELGFAISTVEGSDLPVPGVNGYPVEQGSPFGIAVARDGSIFVAEDFRHTIRKITKAGKHSIVAGSPAKEAFSGDGGPAVKASLRQPSAVALGRNGDLFIADPESHRVRKIDKNGIITTVAGTGRMGFTGEDGPATKASLNYPFGVAVDADGAVYISDQGNHRIRRIGADGNIRTVAGCGETGDSTYVGDQGPATKACLNSPARIAIGPDGSLFIADFGNHRIRRVGSDGIINTVVGTGEIGYAGEDGPATKAELNFPSGVDVAPDGSLYVADKSNHRLLHIRNDGTVKRIAGTKNGKEGDSGDGGPASKGTFYECEDVAVSPTGEIFAVDYRNSRVRRIGAPELNGSSNLHHVASRDGSVVYTFDEDGRHLWTTDSWSGMKLFEFEYDDEGKLLTIKDRNGAETKFEYDSENCASGVVTKSGLRTKLTTGKDGLLSSVESPGGRKAQFSYETRGLLHSSTIDENTKSFSYDALGKLVKHTNPEGGVTELSSLKIKDGIEVTRKKPSGDECRFSFLRFRNGEQKKECVCCHGGKSTAKWDRDKDLSIEDPDGTKTEINVEPDQRFGLQSLLPKNWQVESPSGLMLKGSFKRTIKPAKLPNSLEFEQVTSKLEINGRSYQHVLDRKKRVEKVSSPEGKTCSVEFDEKWRPTKFSPTAASPVQLTYNDDGKIASMFCELSDGTRKYELSYDKHLRVSAIRQPTGSQIKMEYDANGLICRLIRADNSFVDLKRDAKGNVVAVKPPGKPQHNLSYSKAGRLVKYAAPDGKTRQWQYDLDGNLIAAVKASGDVIKRSFEKGELQTEAGAKDFVKYSYNKIDQLNKLESAGVVLNYAYDGRMLIKVEWQGAVCGSVERTYNSDFLTKTISINDKSKIDLDYDADRYLVKVGELEIDRNKSTGKITGLKLGKLSEKFEYNKSGAVIYYEAALNGKMIFSATYKRDVLDRVIEVQEETISKKTESKFCFDQLGQLVSGSYSGKKFECIYDSNGNRSSASFEGIQTKAEFDDCDRIISLNGNTFSYSADGCLIATKHNNTGVTYAYNEFNALTAVKNATDDVSYIVDPVGRRIVRKSKTSSERRFLYGSLLSPVAELDSDNNVLSIFVYGTRTHVPDYMIQGREIYRLISNHIGSVRLVVNAQTGKIAQELEYDPVGKITYDSCPGFQPFGFSGGIYDPSTGLTHFGQRDYDASMARWTCPDPILFAGKQTNFYSYCANDPVNYSDPAGLTLGAPAGGVYNNSPEPVVVVGDDGHEFIVGPGQHYHMPIPLLGDAEGAWVGDNYYPIYEKQPGLIIDSNGNVTTGTYIPLPFPILGKDAIPVPVDLNPLHERPAEAWDKKDPNSRMSPTGSGDKEPEANTPPRRRKNPRPGCMGRIIVK